MGSTGAGEAHYDAVEPESSATAQTLVTSAAR